MRCQICKKYCGALLKRKDGKLVCEECLGLLTKTSFDMCNHVSWIGAGILSIFHTLNNQAKIFLAKETLKFEVGDF